MQTNLLPSPLLVPLSDDPLMAKLYDFVVFGASGYTGQYVVEELMQIAIKDDSINWAIAGRDARKLTKCLADAEKNTGITLTKAVPQIICDVNDPAALVNMAKQTKVVLNCVGPYRFYGEAVVKACLEGGAHHLDISGEPQFLESMQLKYQQEAREKGVYIVGACGFDSIPAEAGILYMEQQFPDVDINEVESFMDLKSGAQGTRVNYGTWLSAIHGFAHRNELAGIRLRLFPNRLPRAEYPQAKRGMVAYNSDVHGWIVPFPGSDKTVVIRTQRFRYDVEKKRPIQYAPYFQRDSFIQVILMALFGVVFGIMSSFGLTRRLLEKYPGFFSAGTFSTEGPTREQVRDNYFIMRFTGKGWRRGNEEPTDGLKKRTSPPDTKMEVQIKGPDYGYVTCAICLVQCGLTVLREAENMPDQGGVLAPGAAFAHTRLLEHLQERSIVFEKLSP